jgi:hypothetical protein
MKKYIICGLFILTLLSSITASAQWGRHNSRYDNRHYYYNRFPYRSSVSVIASLPFGAVSVLFGNSHYHYYNGLYYRPYDRGYIVVQPPIGIIVPSLPPGCISVMIGPRPYYRYENVFYVPLENNHYRVVEKPEEEQKATSNNEKTMTSEYEKIVLEGRTYYKKGSKYYKASVNKDGEIVYEEVGEAGK